MLFKRTLLTLLALFTMASGMPVYAEQAPTPEVTAQKDAAAASTEIGSVLGIKKLYAETPSMLTTGVKFNAAIKTLAAGKSKTYSSADSLIKSVQVVNTPPSGSIATKDVSANQDGSYLAWWDAGTNTINLYSKSGDVILNPNSSGMFYTCSSLTTLDASNWNTSKVTNMVGMFNGCSRLTTLDASGWNTSRVKNMDSMFANCSKLATLDDSNWNTSQVTNMNGMFYSCKKLTTLDASNWNTSKVTNMVGMFNGCSSLTTLDASGWNTSRVKNMDSMFANCSKLATLDVSNWDTGKVTNMNCMLQNCSSLTTMNVSDWNTSNVTIMSAMFQDCSSLTALDVSGWNTGSVTNMSRMFNRCSKLTTLDVSGWNTGSVTNMSGMFNGCSNLTTMDVSKWNTSRVTNMYAMFAGCSSLTTLNASNWNTSQVTNMNNMFSNCSSLTTLDVSRWNTSQVTDMSCMFIVCSNLTTLDLSGWDTSQVTNMGGMFRGCGNLTTIYIGSNWNTDKVTFSGYMFTDCSKLPNFDASAVDKTYANALPDGYLLTKNPSLRYLAKSSFVLTGTSDYGTAVNMIVTSNKSGRMSFKNLEKGTYTLTEVSPTDGYIKNSGKYTVTVTDSGVSIVPDNADYYYETEGQKVLFNEPYHAFTIQKTSSTDSTIGVAGAEFLLSGVSDYGTEVSETKTTGSTGIATFDHLEAGNYLLTETKSPEHYALDPVPRVVSINKYGVIKIDGLSKEGSSFIWTDIRNADGTVTITKKWNDTLTGTNAAGRALPSIVISTQRTIPEAVTVTYHAGDGYFGTDQTNKTNRVSYSEAVDQNGNILSADVSKGQEMTPSIAGKAFNAWYLDSALTKKAPDAIADYIKANPDVREISLYAKYIGPMLTDGWVFNAAIKTLAAGTSKSDGDTDSLIQSIQVVGTPPSGSITTKDVSANQDRSYLAWWDAGTRTIKLYSKSGDVVLNPNSSSMFKSCNNLTTLDLSGWDTSQVTEMAIMFYNCSNLTTLGVSGWDTSQLEDLYRMFYNCGSLTTLDVSSWNTSQVTDMGEMFYKCSSLTTLDVSNWDTSQVTDMNNMFNDCSSLTALEVSNWNTGKVINMTKLFNGCENLTTLDVSKWNTGAVKGMYSIFNNCSSLTMLDVSKWNTSAVENMGSMFGGCRKLTTLDVSNWGTGAVTDMSYMFYGCSSLTTLDVSTWDTSKVTNMVGMFSYCSNLTTLDLSSWDTSALEIYNMDDLLDGCSYLASITIGPGFVNSAKSTNVFPTPSKTESGRASTGTWGLGSETSGKQYTADELATLGQTSGALTGTWFAQGKPLKS